MRTIFKVVFVLFVLIGLVSCSKNERVATIIFDNILINADGPLTEGANTAKGEVLNQLNAFAANNKIKVDDIKSAKLTLLNISAVDSTDLNIYAGFNLQFASEKTDMIQAATINKIQPGTKLLNATLASNSIDLLDLLKQDNFILVADASVAKDTSMNIKLKGKIEVEIKY